MSFETTAAVTVVKTLTLLVGGAITYFSYRAYRRTGSGALAALAAGFGVVTVGSLSAGVVDRFLPLPPTLALVVEGCFTLAGFAIILYSLFVGPAERRRRSR